MKNYIIKYPLFFFLFFAFFLRFFSFFPSIIDHDESTYLQIGKELLFGNIYFVDVIDVKPPGIFLITALIQKIFGDSVFLFRALCSGYIALTAFVIYKIKIKISGSGSGALAAGILYILVLSVYTFYGISINTEIFFNLFTVLAFLIFISELRYNFFFAGFLLGLGFIIKQSVLFELLAFGLFFLVSHIYVNKKLQTRYFLRLLSLLAGFLIPFLLTSLYYLSQDHLTTYFFYTFVVPANYPIKREISDLLIFILDFHIRFFPVMFFFYFVLIRMKISFNGFNLKVLLITWVCFDLFAILYSGKSFGHYFVQVMAPVCIIASGIFHYSISNLSFIKKIKWRPILTGTFILFCGISIYFQKKDYYDKPDIPLQISQYLEKDLKKDDQIYVHGYHQIIYYLVNRSSPSKYIHRSVIFEKSHLDALDVDRNQVEQDIIDSNPLYFIENNQKGFEALNEFKLANYTLVKSFRDNGSVNIYKRNDRL